MYDYEKIKVYLIPFAVPCCNILVYTCGMLCGWHSWPTRVCSAPRLARWACRATSRPHTAWEGIITDGWCLVKSHQLINPPHCTGQPMINDQFRVVEEKTVHSRYFDVLDRKIQFPSRDGVRGSLPARCIRVARHKMCTGPTSSVRL